MFLASRCFHPMLVIGILFALVTEVSGQSPPAIPLWPQGLPAGAQPLSEQRLAELKALPPDPERIKWVASPSLTVFVADGAKANGCGMIVCPGGGYNGLAWQKEGIEVAQWLNTLGVTVGVLQYRVPRRDPDAPHREPLQDAQRAVRLMRANADPWKLDRNRIGVLGFSAGGHLTVMTGVNGPKASYEAKDAIDKENCAPNFLCPIYAAYLGEDYDDRTEVELGSLVEITDKTPPMFLSVTADDAYRGVQAASLFIALKQKKVPVELHIYARGGHGYGIRSSEFPVSTWHHRLGDWLRDSGWLQSGSKADEKKRAQ